MKRKVRKNPWPLLAVLSCYNDSCEGEFSHLCEDYRCVREGSLSAVMRGYRKPQSPREVGRKGKDLISD